MSSVALNAYVSFTSEEGCGTSNMAVQRINQSETVVLLISSSVCLSQTGVHSTIHPLSGRDTSTLPLPNSASLCVCIPKEQAQHRFT